MGSLTFALSQDGSVQVTTFESRDLCPWTHFFVCVLLGNEMSIMIHSIVHTHITFIHMTEQWSDRDGALNIEEDH